MVLATPGTYREASYAGPNGDLRTRTAWESTQDHLATALPRSGLYSSVSRWPGGRLVSEEQNGEYFESNSLCQIFVANRLWSQKLEKGLFKQIEDNYQQEAESIAENGVIQNLEAVINYLSIWRIRAQMVRNPPEDVELNLKHVGDVHTKDEEEILRKEGIPLLSRKRGPRSCWMLDHSDATVRYEPWPPRHSFLDSLACDGYAVYLLRLAAGPPLYSSNSGAGSVVSTFSCSTDDRSWGGNGPRL